MARKPVQRTGPKFPDGPVDITAKLSGHFAGNDATVTKYAGSKESMAMEQVPADAARKRAERNKRDRRFKRLRSENRAPTSATPGAYSQATAYVPSGARY